METGYFISTIVPFLIRLAPIVAAIILAIAAWKIRLLFIQQKYILNIKWVLLKIMVPRDVYKSPQAMEIVLKAFHQTFPGHWYDKYVKGIVRSWFSLEIVSIEGKIHFLMYIPTFFKNLIEVQIYSQYPQVEIEEVSDYTKMIPPYKRGGDMKIYGYHFGLRKPDAYPIKTYIDYGLDKAVGSLDEIEKIDPLTPLLELMGSIGHGEQIWFQLFIQAADKEWQKEGVKIIKELKEPYRPKKDRFPEMMTKEIQEKIVAIDRSTSKMGFYCGIQVLYLARKDNYSVSTQVALRGMLTPFDTEGLNSFRRPLVSALEYPWRVLMPFRIEWRKERMFKSYRQRSFFNFPFWAYFWPYSPKPFILNTEEIATIYHFPGGVSETPTLRRIEFKKSEPPPDLPI